MTTYFSRKVFRDGKEFLEKLPVHLEDVGLRSKESASIINLGNAGYWNGRLHDIGKLSLDFLDRLNGSKHRVDHSTAGAAIALKLGSKEGQERVMAEILAHCIAGHHAGLPDTHAPDSGLCERVASFDFESQIDPIWPAFTTGFPDNLSPSSFDFTMGQGKRYEFQISFMGRMLFSMLVDADHNSARDFEDKINGRSAEPEWNSLEELLPRFVEQFQSHIRTLGANKSSVSDVRQKILTQVLDNAALPAGMFTLNVPTGGGKTWASMGFALKHAEKNGHKRIIYAIPFTSILDQTAEQFSRVLGEEHILQHHSAVENRDEPGADIDDRKKSAEDWAAPIILTTTVQLFESLFAAAPSKCRKLKNIVGSVIVLDEVQALPRHLLAPCLAACDELVRNYGCTIVFCTATQPALTHPTLTKMGIVIKATELSIDPQISADALHRVSIQNVGKVSIDQLATEISLHHQALAIMPTRRHALQLYLKMKEAGVHGILHLSTRQTGSHRKKILSDVRERLKTGKPCILIATSLVEAGVDLDFPYVWRHIAGLDQIAQAAGRCNREGKLTPESAIVRIFELDGYEQSPELRALANDSKRVWARHQNPISPQAIKEFFDQNFQRMNNMLDREGILGKFTVARGEYYVNFQYRTVAKEFRLIENRMHPVVIPFGAAGWEEFSEAFSSLSKLKIARSLQQFVVQIPEAALERLKAVGAVRIENLGDLEVAALGDFDLYNPDFGLLWEDDIE
jgi:CRISPR-associated endonuclease/helicase Cas3